ncbi:hypothetical protein ANCCAN_15963, partial [Ancylostoma caninum]
TLYSARSEKPRHSLQRESRPKIGHALPRRPEKPLLRTEEDQDGAPLEIPKNDLDNAWISARTIAGDENESTVCKKDSSARNSNSTYYCVTTPNGKVSYHHTITIVNCYAPNSVASEEDKDNFYSELEAVIRKGKSS